MLAQPSPSRAPDVLPRPAHAATLADVVQAVRAAALPDRRRQDIIAALNTIARVLGRNLDQIPAAPAQLRRWLTDANPLAIGVNPRRWNNIRSLAGAALALVAPGKAERRRTGLTPAWQDLHTRVKVVFPDPRRHADLDAFMRFCAADRIDPDQVDQAVFERFHDSLTSSLRKKPAETYARVCQTWNRLAGLVPEWPAFRVVRESRLQTWTLSWGAFPACLQAEVRAWLDRLSGQDPLAPLPTRPVRPSTVRTRHYQLRVAASALVQRGRDPTSITCLADLADLASYKEILRYLISRCPGGAPTTHVVDIAKLLRTIARHHGRAPQETLDDMAAIIHRLLQPQPSGLTPLNRNRLRPFDDPHNVQAILGLPERLMQDARRCRVPRQAALLAQRAVAIEILLMAPIRIANLAALDLARHLIRTHNKRRVSLVLEGHEVKNGESLDYPLPPESVALLDLYLRDYHPQLAPIGTTMLFPGRTARAKGAANLGRQISQTIRRYTGLAVHPHLFRHLGAKLFLDSNPGTYEVVRRVLGHRSMDTTTSFYTGLETAAAVRHFDATILRLRRNGAAA